MLRPSGIARAGCRGLAAALWMPLPLLRGTTLLRCDDATCAELDCLYGWARLLLWLLGRGGLPDGSAAAIAVLLRFIGLRLSGTTLGVWPSADSCNCALLLLWHACGCGGGTTGCWWRCCCIDGSAVKRERRRLVSGEIFLAAGGDSCPSSGELRLRELGNAGTLSPSWGGTATVAAAAGWLTACGGSEPTCVSVWKTAILCLTRTWHGALHPMQPLAHLTLCADI